MVLLMLFLVLLVPVLTTMHARWLIPLEDPEHNGIWIIGYKLWEPGYVPDYSQPNWLRLYKEKVLRNDIGYTQAHDEVSARSWMQVTLRKAYPACEHSITYCFYSRRPGDVS